ncbi:uncharacterized protein BKA55DRAFT_217567 [Fusarium redolens]|uniref:Uncharacterized protein n=1 Tax=Fusarium redolens TaxID=48865 RepID=A0A9P9FXK7_FUSRE|nr:uncharacterized protein BKA55DRAFT_217567 [Fusarium redolens]KAH7216899.1 hypothetical protein BKA55DRAFT_217567 [Fusarium redolens]
MQYSTMKEGDNDRFSWATDDESAKRDLRLQSLATCDITPLSQIRNARSSLPLLQLA